MSRGFVIPTLLLTFLIVWGVPALAQVQPIEGCTVIDKPGSYMVAKDITAKLEDLKWVVPERDIGACILIVADFVSLDLQGHLLKGPQIGEFPNNAGIYATADASGKEPTADHIRNGSVTGFNMGVSVEGTAHIVEQMRVLGNNAGMTLRGNGIKVKEVTAVSNQSHGILWFDGYGVSVENCQISSNRYIGILQFSFVGDQDTQSPAVTLGSRIVGNTVTNNGAYGIYAGCPTLFLQNMVHNNGSRPEDNFHIVHRTNETPCVRSDNSPAP